MKCLLIFFTLAALLILLAHWARLRLFTVNALYTGWTKKMAQCIDMPVTFSNINRFSKFFHCRNQEKMCSNASLKITPRIIYVATLPCEMSDIALKLAMTYCVINVDQAWPVVTKQTARKSSWLCCLGCTSKDGLSMSTIHVKQPAEAGDHHWWSSRSIWLAASWSLASPAWVRCPAARQTHWTFGVKTARCDSYFWQ